MARDYLIAAVAQAIGLASAGGTTIIIARLLGPGGRGEYAVLTGLVQLLAMAGQLGFLAGAVQMGSRDAVAPARLFRYAQTLPLVTGLLGSATLGAIVFFGPASMHQAGPAAVVAMIVLPILLAAQTRSCVLLALRQPAVYNVLFIVQQLTMVAGVTIASIIRPSAASALVGWLTSCLLWAALASWQVRRRLRPAPWSTLTLSELGRVLAFGAQSTGGSVLQLASSRLSLFIVSAQHGSAAAGVYSIATALAETMWQAVAAVAQVNLPAASAAYASGVRPEGVQLGSRLAAALTVIAAFALAALAPVLVPIVFGVAFAPAVLPLRLLLIGTGLFGLSLLLTVDLLARGYPRGSAVAAGVMLTTTVGLCLVLVPPFGPTGAAAAAATGYVAATLVSIWMHRRLADDPPSRLIAPSIADVGAALGVIRRRLSRATLS